MEVFFLKGTGFRGLWCVRRVGQYVMQNESAMMMPG